MFFKTGLLCRPGYPEIHSVNHTGLKRTLPGIKGMSAGIKSLHPYLPDSKSIFNAIVKVAGNPVLCSSQTCNSFKVYVNVNVCVCV